MGIMHILACEELFVCWEIFHDFFFRNTIRVSCLNLDHDRHSVMPDLGKNQFALRLSANNNKKSLEGKE